MINQSSEVKSNILEKDSDSQKTIIKRDSIISMDHLQKTMKIKRLLILIENLLNFKIIKILLKILLKLRN